MTKVTIKSLLAHKLRLAFTALAIVLGVTFVSGTLVLTDTLNRTFDTLIGHAYQHINFQIRGKAAFGNAAAGVNYSRPQAGPRVGRDRGPPSAHSCVRGRVRRGLRPVRGP